jgi:ABC transport system ATP-binding/permease protein
MVLLTAEDISKAYGVNTLFEGVDLSISDRDKIGLVGVNGSGKSTLLGILAGLEPADSGEVSTARDMRMEMLSQQPELDDELSALDQVLTDGPPEFEVVRAYEHASRRLAAAPEDAELVERVSRLAEKMDRLDGWSLENDAKTILSRVGIDDVEQQVGTMSGGQRRRVALARALVRPSDLLILDEPTNHLDVETIEWLEGRLKERTGGLLMVTHDRYFLDRVCQVIIELDNQTLHRYEGNYSTYLEKRAERHELLKKREEKRKNLARRELEWLRRGPKARTTKSKARVDRAHELLDSSHLPDERGEVEIDTVETRLGKKTVVLEDVHKSFGELCVIDGFSYNFARDDRVGIVGPNGAGKSTLLDIITGRLEPDAGSVEVGETITFGYYDQEAIDLDPAERVHDYIVGISNRIETTDGFLTATQMLEKFLFDRRRQWEPIKNLSGGECRRLYLLGVLMRSPNFLLLDEPTNDLDVETLNILEDYLDGFGGVLIVVSHDRHFLDRAVEHLLVFDDQGRIDLFPGTYTPWAEHRKQQQAAEAERRRQQQQAQREASTPQPTEDDGAPKQLSYKEKRELEALEARIDEIEAQLEALDQRMVDEAADYQVVQELAAQKDQLEAELEASFERWTELAERA